MVTARDRDSEAVRMYRHGYRAGREDMVREIVERLRTERVARDLGYAPGVDPVTMMVDQGRVADWMEREYLNGGDNE